MAFITEKVVADCEQQAMQLLAPWLESGDLTGAVEFSLRDGIVVTNETRQSLVNFFLLLWMIETRAFERSGKARALDDLVATAEGFLRSCKIRPTSSRFAGLYGRLYRALSAAHAHAGDSWRALWQATVGQAMIGPGEEQEHQLFVADRALCQGYLESAASTYLKVEAEGGDPELLAAARLGRALCHKLSGGIEQAWAVASDTPPGLSESHDLYLELTWQACLCEALASRTLEPVLRAFDPRSPLHKARFALKASLLAYAMGQESASRKLKRASTLKSIFAEISRGTYEHHMYKMLAALEACRDDTIDPGERIRRLGDDLSRVREQGVIEDTLLVLAAATRWLEASREPRFASLLRHEYTGICLKLSTGRSLDVLGLLQETKAGKGSPKSAPLPPPLAVLPASSVTGSLLKLSAIAARLSLMHARQGLKRTFRAAPLSQEERAQFLSEMAHYLVRELGTLKGPIMKFGQLLSGIRDIPLEARLELQEALSSTRSVAPEIFLRVFKAEQGKAVDEVFRRFDRAPIGVGSMGQVFRAELMDGREVAVKIHYPGLEKAIRGFGPIVRLLLVPLKQLLPRIDVYEVGRRVLECFADECDMRKEAAKHRVIQDAYHDHPDIIVPRLVPELVSTSVLVTEYVPGRRLFEFLPSASREDRLRFYEIIIRNLADAAGRLGWLQLDPHGGNYLYHEGKVVCLDFGSMIELSREGAAAFRDLSIAVLSEDMELLWRAHIEHKIFDPAYITREFHDEVLARLAMADHHPGLQSHKQHLGDTFKLVSDERIRLGVIASPELALWFLPSAFLAALRQTMGIDPQD